jgi:hypothetical protein
VLVSPCPPGAIFGGEEGSGDAVEDGCLFEELTAMVLGHSNVSFTAATYIHPDEQDLATVGDALNAAFESGR